MATNTVNPPTRKNDNWATPDWLYKALDAEFGFTLDPCPLNPNWTVDGLTLNWDGQRVFVNPPFSNIKPWVEKALASRCLTVLLLPSDRCDSAWFQLLREAELRDQHLREVGLSDHKRVEIRFLRKRVAYQLLDEPKKQQPNGGSLIAVVDNQRVL